jgi:hypothetical protein
MSSFGRTVSRRQRLSGDRAGDDGTGKTPISEMEKNMKKSRLPNSDSIQELAAFWDTHDLTEFEDELEEVSRPVFMRVKPIEIKLEPREAKAVQQMAKAKGVSREELIRAWVLQEIDKPSGRPVRRRA